MKGLWRLLVTLGLMAAVLPAALAAQPPMAQEQFEPLAPGELPEVIPAAPLVIAAYAIVWLVFAFYLFTVWRRISRVETELQAVTARLEKGSR